MRIFKRLVWLVVICVAVTAMLNFLLAQPSIMKIMLHEAKEQQCDTVFVGHSHGETGIDPFIVDEQLGWNAINCSRRLTRVENYYYIVKQCAESGTLQRVVVELDDSYWGNISDISPGLDSNALYYLSPRYQPEYLVQQLLNENFSLTLFNYDVNMDAVKRIPKNVKAKWSKNYWQKSEKAIPDIPDSLGANVAYRYVGKGFRYGVKRNPDPQFPYATFSEENVPASVVKGFERLVDFCRQNDIELIAVTYPLTQARLMKENHEESERYFSALCQEYGIAYYDLNRVKQEYLPRTDDDFYDVDGHMMGELAERHTALFCTMIKENHPQSYYYENYEDLLSSFN